MQSRMYVNFISTNNTIVLTLIYYTTNYYSYRNNINPLTQFSYTFIMASNYPLLPGYAPTQTLKEHFKKASHIKQEANRNIPNVETTNYLLPRHQELEDPDQTRMLHPDYLSTTHDHFGPKNIPKDTTTLYQPNWVKLDRHVLRFYGYFKESVAESNLQNYRIRKLVICFYLQDNSLSISQEKQQNSGIPQGIFLKREKAIKQNGRFFTPDDFIIGQDVNIYGKSIHLYNCDVYTRQFFEKQNKPQGPAEDCPQDPFQKKASIKFVPVKDAEMKDYLEKKLGGGRVTSQKQFLENDRKVLKFYAVSDCNYIIHYFLADDTIEVREVAEANSGKDPFPVTFKRQKLYKKFVLGQPGQTHAQDFLKADQLGVGKTIEVFSKVYHLVDCDEFTRDYYKTRYGIDFPKFQKPQDGQQLRSNIIIPPHNGFGDEQDSLGYVYRLIPKPPKKDFFKWVDQQVCLRFTARFNTNKPEDVERSFIITFYLNDDSLQIYEPPIRNSGISEGKFLQRKQYKNVQNDNQKFGPCDLIVGSDAVINGYSFHITDCDLFTKKWFAENTIREPIQPK